jgi:hypothetical protein
MSDRSWSVFLKTTPEEISIQLHVMSVRSFGDISIDRDKINDSKLKKEFRNVTPLTQECVLAGIAEIKGIFDDSFPGRIGSA